MATNGTSTTNGAGGTPDITLYTNHGCPWAHRAHIAIKELGLSYKEEIIDLGRPRDPWYLKINPRGLVPSIKYNDQIITESAVVSQFLADAHASHLLPPSSGGQNALHRARVQFFADTFTTKVTPQIFGGLRVPAGPEQDAATEELIKTVAKEMEPLFTWDAAQGPFFGGSDKLTLAEALTGPFILRLLALSKPEHSMLNPKIPGLLQEQAPRFYAWATKVAEAPSVTYIWDEKTVVNNTKARMAKMAAEKKL